MHRPQSAKLSEQLSLRLLEGILSVARLSDLQGLLFDEIEQVVPCIGKLFLHRQDSENLTVSQYTFGKDLKNISEVYSQFSPNLSEDEFRLFRQVLESEVPLLVEKGSLDDADNFTRERFDWWQLESVLYIPLADAVIVLFSRHPILRSQVTEIQLISSLLAARINESIEHERLQQEKERILIARKSYQRMLKLTEKINYLLSLDEFFDVFMGELLEIFGFEIAGVQLEENGLLPPRHWKTVNSELEAKTREVMNYFADLGNAYKIDPPEGGSCYTYLNNKHMYVPDFSALAGLPMKPKDAIVMEMLDIKIKSIIQVPIRKSGSPVGVLQMWSFSHEVCLSENDIDTIYSICSIIPSIIRNSELYSTVAAQKEMLDFQHQELQEKNREVLDSIAYARRLQLNSLPSDSLLDQVIPQRVLIWLPRDIVGGDMYWVVSSGVFQYLAVFDCTGHGVPGAFMSVITQGLLSEIVQEYPGIPPAALLELLDTGLRQRTSADDGHGHTGGDGADAVICRFDATDPGGFLWAGAKRGLVHVRPHKGANTSRDAELTRISGQRRSLGYGGRKKDREFVDQYVAMSPGDWVYLFTDGFTDQDGGERGFGFGQRRFMDLLGRVAGRDSAMQREVLLCELASYQGARRQRDDITVIGFGWGK